jgi:hypothetical protein
MAWSLTSPKLQSDEDPFGIRQIADDLLDRFRHPPHERRHCQNLVAARELLVLQSCWAWAYSATSPISKLFKIAHIRENQRGALV